MSNDDILHSSFPIVHLSFLLGPRPSALSFGPTMRGVRNAILLLTMTTTLAASAATLDQRIADAGKP